MIRAHVEITQTLPDALLVIAPRFLQSADEIETNAKRVFKHVARRSRNEAPDTETEVYIADTIGEMGLWYRLSPISFVGHSLGPDGKPLGGKNPYEAAALQSVVLHGPAVSDFAETYQGLQSASASILVTSEADLAASVLRLMDEVERTPVLQAANNVVKARRGVLDVTWKAIAKHL